MAMSNMISFKTSLIHALSNTFQISMSRCLPWFKHNAEKEQILDHFQTGNCVPTQLNHTGK